MNDLEDKAFMWLVVIGVGAIFFLGVLLGKYQDKWDNRRKLALTVEEANALLAWEYVKITKENDLLGGTKGQLISEVNKVCDKLANRLYDKNIVDTYKLYAYRDSFINEINARK